MKNYNPITAELRNTFNRLLYIDPGSASGLCWKVARGKVKPGAIAGTLRSDGYWQICIDRRLFANHRIIWSIGNKQDPEGLQIDHIDGNSVNNSLSNLRIATIQENQWNRVNLACNNTSGFQGVDWIKHQRKWRARIKINSKDISLGAFKSIEEAVAARREGELKYYGEFSPIRKL
jgi:hypothetical protein